MAVESSDAARPAAVPTRWSLIARAQHIDPCVREQALGELLSLYHPVIRKFLIAGIGMPADDADDLLQGFVADKIMGMNVLTGVRAGRGRFRNFLFKSCRHYFISELRKKKASKRSVEGRMGGVEELHNLRSDDPSLNHLYNLEWARQTLAEVMVRMQRECGQKRRMDLWEIFEGRIIQPLLGGGAELPYETLVERFGFESPTQAFNALVTAKRMFKRLLEEVVRDTVETEDQVQQEIRELKRILST